MCMMSAVTQYAQDIPLINWTPVTWKDFKELCDRVDALDKALGEPDCIDPKKAEWLKKMEELYDEAHTKE